MVIEISTSQDVRAPIEKVWEIVGDLQNEHKLWSEFRGVKILSKTRSTVEREAMIRRGPMGEEKSLQILSIDPDHLTTTLTMTKGLLLGTRKITLTEIGKDQTKIDVEWKAEMKGVPAFAMGLAKGSISGATEKALAEIAEDAECQ
jgi:carbon monoxide dehydrogenase subunit G